MSNKKMVVFKIGSEEFAADIMQVERILGYSEPTRIPDSPGYISGVIKYQDMILPVMNLKKKFNLNEDSLRDDAKIIVVRHGNRSIGLIVDMVSEVIDIDSESIEVTPEIVRGISNRYISGMIKLNDRIIILIDTASILTREDIKEIEELTK